MNSKTDSLQLEHRTTGGKINLTPEILSKLLRTDDLTDLRYPTQWIRFLNSPQGKKLLAFLKDDLALFVAAMENRVQSQISTETMKKLIAYLYSVLSSLKYHERSYDVPLRTEAKKVTETQRPLSQTDISARISTLTDAIGYIDEKLALKRGEYKALELDLATIEQEILNAKEKYEHYDNFFNETHNELNQMDLINPVDWLNNKIQAMQPHTLHGAKKLADLVESEVTSGSTSNGSIQETFRENFLRLFKLQMYSEMLAHLQKKKIVRHEGENYLLQKEQSVDKLSVEHKDSARQAYLDLTPRLVLRFKAAKDKQKEAEFDYLDSKKLSLVNKLAENKVAVQQLEHQKSLFRAEIQVLEKQLEPEHTQRNSYTLMINSMNPPTPSPANLKKLQDAVKESKEISPELKHQVAQLQPAVPMSRELWIQLMRFRPHLASSPDNKHLMAATLKPISEAKAAEALVPFHPIPKIK
jgi:hypothetical protein